MTLKEIEKDLNKLSTIRFKRGTTFTNVKQVIDRAIRDRIQPNRANNYWTEEYKELNKDSSTYNANRNRLQCDGSRLRGVADLYRLARYYFPNTTLKEVLSCLEGIPHQECSTTNQTVFRRNSHNSDSLKGISIRLSNRKKVFIKDIE